jgi:hypothetical protein
VDDPDGRGIAGFPRFNKRRRPDKSIKQATRTDELAHLFHKQTRSLTVMSTIPACHASVAFPLGLAWQLVMIQYVIYNSSLLYL